MKRADGEKNNLIVICGIKNSGKTTLCTRLIRHFTEAGLRVAYIKHDGHDFCCDLPGTDSHAAVEAGAYGAAVFSPARFFVHKQTEDIDFMQIRALFPEADLILAEGLKHTPHAKIEVIRSAVSTVPVSEPRGRFLLVTDLPEGTFDEPCLCPDDIAGIAQAILAVAQPERKEGCQ